MKDKVDILIKGGTLVTMDMEGTMYEDGILRFGIGETYPSIYYLITR